MSVSVGDEKAIITIEVELVSSIKGDPTTEGFQEPFLSDASTEQQDAIIQQIHEDIADEVKKSLEDEGVQTEGLADLTEMVGKIKGEGIDNITKFATSPQGFMEHGLIRILGRAGPHGAIAVALIALIASMPEMVTAVVNALGVKGAPLNQDFAWTEDEQVNQQFDRTVQFRRMTGDDPVITVTTKGFVTGDPDFIDNSLVDANLARIGRVNLRDTSLGYIHGI